MNCPNKGFTTFSLHKRGFTLIELLVVISIIAILSVVGFTSFTNVQKGAKDAKRKADIDAIAKAYEVKYKDDIGQYTPLDNTAFTSGATPQDPSSSKGDYFNVKDTNNKGFKVCASLENNSSQLCNNADANCYCKESTQGKIPPDTPSSALSGTGATTIGLGPTTCIPSLSQNLIGYWKMDEGSDNTVDDSSSMNNQTLALYTGAAWVDGKIGKALKRTSEGDFGTIPDADHLDGMQNLTISAWVYPTELNNKDRNIFNKGAYNATLSKDGYYMAYRLMYQTEWVDESSVHPEGYWSLDYKYLDASGNIQNSFFGLPHSSSDPKENKWHLVTGVYKGGPGGQATLYDMVEGSTSTTAPRSVSESIRSNSANVVVGTDFIGIIDEIRLYDKALSPQEVQALYNGGNGCIPQ